ncbi:hypothetical protein [Listeria booriae]|uniref:hypothetical protein n=1 Tax=Listeria booriae TaxID=1552123 RepID=UPI001628227B|nr:hypothetical protein [Listeria booriae]MBC2190519.1 hypothetical protein [Listeria booriae]
MNIIKKGGVVRAKKPVILLKRNGISISYAAGTKFKVEKIMNSNILKVKPLGEDMFGTLRVENLEVIR